MKYYYIIDDVLTRRGYLDVTPLSVHDKEEAISLLEKEWESFTEFGRQARDYYALGESDEPDIVNPDYLKIIKVMKK